MRDPRCLIGWHQWQFPLRMFRSWNGTVVETYRCQRCSRQVDRVSPYTYPPIAEDDESDMLARIRAACEPLMTETLAVTERWGEDVVEVPVALWHQWQRDMEALLSKEDGE